MDSNDNFSLESITPDTPVAIDDKERCVRVRLLCSNVMYPKLSMWDRDFLTDIHGQRGFSPRQRVELDRIWDLWGSQV